MLMDCITVTPEFVADSINGYERTLLEALFVIKKKRQGVGLGNPRPMRRLEALGWIEIYDNAGTPSNPGKATEWMAMLRPEGRNVTRTLRSIWRSQKR